MGRDKIFAESAWEAKLYWKEFENINPPN